MEDGWTKVVNKRAISHYKINSGKKQLISVEIAIVYLLINWEHYNAFFII